MQKRHEPNKLTRKPWEEWLSGRVNNVTYELKQQEELSFNKISTLLTLILTCSQAEVWTGSEPEVHTESSLLTRSCLLLPSTEWQISTTLDYGWGSAKMKYISFSLRYKKNN